MGILEHKIAIVTGGAGALGSAVVATLLAEGAHVFVPTHQANEIDTLRKQLGLPADATLSGEPLDLTDIEATARCYAGVAEQLGGIDILVNIAGGFAGGQPVHETGWDVWQSQLDINLKTSVSSCKAAIPHMLARGGGAIVNVSSRTASQHGANLAAYAAAKRAILQLTEALAEEYRGNDITANAIMPSVIDTPANRAAMAKADYTKWVTPAAIARVILFLVGPDAQIISGAAVPVYGKA
jgi:NAD(P)-dependent dehydrogenase (short-subunit alcohol dehydrogenase family)